MKAFLFAIEAGHANAEDDYEAFERKTAAVALVHNEVGRGTIRGPDVIC